MSNPKKPRSPLVIMMIFCNSLIALTIIGFNSKLVVPRTFGYSPCSSALRFEPQFSSLLDGHCNCTSNYVLDNGIIRPELSCNCVEGDCSPLIVTNTVRVMPPIAEVVREVAKSNISSDLSAVEKKPKEVKPCENKQDAPVVKNVVEFKPWYIKDKTWHYPSRFPLCSMDACFNFSRCDDMDELKIFVYDRPSTPLRFFAGFNDTQYVTHDPDKACLLFIFLDGEGPWNPHPRELPHWNSGINHVLITFADMWKQKGPPQETIGNASVMASDIHETIYRAGFDISLPLPPNHRMHELQHLPALGRKYFLTFRGLRYLGTGEGVFRSYDSFRNMHNGKDIIVATSCKHPINDAKRQEEPELGIHCDEDQKIYDATEFKDLMNTTFALVPSGIQPSSYRFIEVLSAGCIPVLIADNYVRPYDTIIQWQKCLIQFPTTEMHRIVKSLRAIRVEYVVQRQLNCVAIYQEFLKDNDALLRTTIRSLKARFMGVFPALEDSL
ncbi:hypothetical protein R1flu_019777 [Riccia fluitans]|uniref:Exostosin GT47 domain-containing protein n=1 Tax=Riccia fluitans TaxID=41844 RepID=A0ABD1ZNF8_9MARC